MLPPDPPAVDAAGAAVAEPGGSGVRRRGQVAYVTGFVAVFVGLVTIGLTVLTWFYEVVALFGLESVDTPERREELDRVIVITAGLHGIGVLAVAVGSVALTIAAARLTPWWIAAFAWTALYLEIVVWAGITKFHAGLGWSSGVPTWFTSIAIGTFALIAASTVTGIVRTILLARRCPTEQAHLRDSGDGVP